MNAFSGSMRAAAANSGQGFRRQCRPLHSSCYISPPFAHPTASHTLLTSHPTPQTIIGLKVREVYERITEKEVVPVS